MADVLKRRDELAMRASGLTAGLHTMIVSGGMPGFTQDASTSAEPRPSSHAAHQAMLPICAISLLGSDLLALCVSLLGAIGVCYSIAGPIWSASTLGFDLTSLQNPLTALAVTAAIVFASFTMRGHYLRRIPFWSEFQDITAVSLVALLSNGFFNFILQQTGNRRFLIVTWVLFPVAAVCCRRWIRRGLSRAGLWQIRTVILGDVGAARDVTDALRSEPGLGYEVVGTLDVAALAANRTRPNWRSLLLQFNAGLLVVAGDAHTLTRGVIESLVRSRVPFAIAPPLAGLPVLGFEQTRFFSSDTVIFSYRNNLAKPLARLTKGIFDYVAALVGVVVLAPVLVLIAALVKMDGGPALYGHVRVGAHGRTFKCLKFRSMVTNSDAVLERLLATDPRAAREWAATRKLTADPRITWIGRFLRGSSLDELPQLFNVLRLEMSLVGPRPIVGAEVSRYGEDIVYYYETRPGMTGLWQISGRTDTTYNKRVQLDTWYAKNWTIWHDIAIIAKTVPAVLNRRGAY